MKKSSIPFDKNLIKDILDSIDKINFFVSNLSKEDFINDEKSCDAVLYKLIIIGEASNKLSNEFKDKNQQIPWREIIALRNIAVHEYFGVNTETIWTIINKEIPTLKTQLENLLNA